MPPAPTSRSQNGQDIRPEYTKKLPDDDLFAHLDLPVHRCALVSSSGALLGSGLGPRIDAHHLVMRLNNAPVAGFEKDVGAPSQRPLPALHTRALRPRPAADAPPPRPAHPRRPPHDPPAHRRALFRVPGARRRGGGRHVVPREQQVRPEAGARDAPRQEGAESVSATRRAPRMARRRRFLPAS